MVLLSIEASLRLYRHFSQVHHYSEDGERILRHRLHHCAQIYVEDGKSFTTLFFLLDKERKNVVHCHMMWWEKASEAPRFSPPHAAHILPADVPIPQTLQSASSPTNWYPDANCKCPGHAEWKMWILSHGFPKSVEIHNCTIQTTNAFLPSEKQAGLLHPYEDALFWTPSGLTLNIWPCQIYLKKKKHLGISATAFEKIRTNAFMKNITRNIYYVVLSQQTFWGNRGNYTIIILIREKYFGTPDPWGKVAIEAIFKRKMQDRSQNLKLLWLNSIEMESICQLDVCGLLPTEFSLHFHAVVVVAGFLTWDKGRMLKLGKYDLNW